MDVSGTVRTAGSSKGIAGVPVCNGEVYVVSGDDGQYEIPVEPGAHAFVWVSMPDGFAAADRFYRGLPGDLSSFDGFDFELSPKLSGDRFRLAHVTDLHLIIEQENPNLELTSPNALEQALESLVERSNPDLIVLGGDLTNLGTPEEMGEVSRILSRLETPLFPLFGNHDGANERRIQLAQEGKADKTFTRHYEQCFGPPYYSFDWGGAHFVMYMDFDRCLSPADQVRRNCWMDADLSRQPSGRRIVVVLHGPPPADLLQQLSRFEVSTVLYGHRHSSKVVQHDGIEVICTPSFCFGGTDTAPAGYRLLDFAKNEIEHQAVALDQERLTIQSPLRMRAAAKRLELMWERRIPGDLHRAAPNLHGNNILLSLRDETRGHDGGVLCLDATDGRERWRFRSGASIKSSVAVSPSGMCAAASVHGEVFLLEADGTLRWKARLPGYPELFLYTAPLITDSAIHIVEKGLCAALSLETGELIWSRSMDPGDEGQITFRRGVSGRDVPSFTGFVEFGDLLVGLVPGRGLVGLRRGNGEIAWELGLEGGKQAFAPPILMGDRLVSGGTPNELVMVNLSSGAVVWRREALEADYPTGLAVAGGRLFASAAVGGLRCFDSDSADLVWRFETGEDLLDMIPRRRGLRSILAPPVIVGDHLIFGANDGHLYLLHAETGECEVDLDLGAPVTAAPCTTAAGFCVGTWDGRLFQFRLRED